MRLFILFLMMCYTLTSFSQEETTIISNKIIAVTFDDATKPVKRKLLAFRNKLAYFNPFTYVGAGMLFVYQNVFSEQIQANCAYEISCSDYTKFSIQVSGFFIGTLKGFNQLSECAPTARYEHPASYINSDGKIINHFEKKIK